MSDQFSDLFDSAEVKYKNKEYHVRELSIKEQSITNEAYKKHQDGIRLQAHIVKFGCKECADLSVDEVMEQPIKLNELLLKKINELSVTPDDDEDDEKKSA